MENTALNDTTTKDQDWKQKKGYGPIIVVVSLALLLGLSFYAGRHSDEMRMTNVVASSASSLSVGKKTKPPTMNPTTAQTEDPVMVGGCYVDFQFSITNKLDVALYAISSITSHGYLYVGDGACNDCKYDKQCTYNNCMNIPPGGTHYFKTEKSSPCQGVEGIFTYGPSNAAYTARMGLETITLNFKDGGGANGKVIATQQMNVPTPKEYEFGYNIPTASSCSNSMHCVENFTVEITKSPPTPVPDSVKDYNGSWESIASDATAGISAGTSWTDTESSTIGTSFESGFNEEVSTKFGETQVTVGASQEMGKSSSNTISQEHSGSYGSFCTANACNGRLYQWQTLADYIKGPTQIVKSCFFKCVPYSTHNGPQCPYGFCASNSCQCCNAVWMKDNNSPTANHLELSAGGTCNPKCKANAVACSNNEECCTGTCNKGGLLPTGGTCA